QAQMAIGLMEYSLFQIRQGAMITGDDIDRLGGNMEYAAYALVAAGIAYIVLNRRRKLRKRRNRPGPFDGPFAPLDGDGSHYFLCIRQGDGSYLPGFLPSDPSTHGSASTEKRGGGVD